VIIEVLSFVSRPVSHSVRLFANMLAGHITLQVFAGFIIMLRRRRNTGWFGAVLPFAMVVALTRSSFWWLPAGLRLRHPHLHLLNDAIHPGH